jgi:tetratricopeptide (TPR) repeat protein
MTAKTSLELKGIIRAHPVAEILLEVSQAELTGSLRVEMGDQKTIIYFLDGQAAYAVSNEKRSRLFKILLDQGLIDKEYLAQNRTHVSDLQLAEKIEADGKLSRNDLQTIISAQCESVIALILTWSEGEWTFSPHARLKSGVGYTIKLNEILMTYGRNVASEIATARITNPNEWFSRRRNPCDGFELRQEEAYILSRLDWTAITLHQINAMIGDAVSDVLKTVYSLWLGGHLSRAGWPAAFSEERLAYLRSANLELKKPAQASISSTGTSTPERVVARPEPEIVEAEAIFDLDENLDRIESAQNSYDVLGLLPSAKIADIRKAYYRLAKMLHPDRYRRESAEILRRIENAFTELGQAHESIKTPEARQNYDMRMRQAERENVPGDAESGERTKQGDQAAGDFERGFALQLEGEFEAAVPFLARAAYYEPKNARYRAYYGKALSADDDQRHKAEKELVTAVQLEPTNETFRLMLAEFFIKYKLIKRAEGELSRLLEISPGHKDALRLLDRLQAK